MVLGYALSVEVVEDSIPSTFREAELMKLLVSNVRVSILVSDTV